jgi:hypothetical protein
MLVGHLLAQSWRTVAMGLLSTDRVSANTILSSEVKTHQTEIE